MGETRNVHIVGTDEALIASARNAVAALDGWEVRVHETQAELVASPPVQGDLLLLDAWLRGPNVYELCRSLAGRTHCRTFVVVEQGNPWAQSIARFCGATGTLERPIAAGALRGILAPADASPPAPLPTERREHAEYELPEALLTDINTGERHPGLVRALIDTETGLFNYAFLNFKLDEEFKRSRRFDQPLTCAMLGFEGQAGEQVLRELAAIFLESSRDTDVLGRFDESSFLFLLPNTGPDGGHIMAARIAALVEERDLVDLVGDPLVVSAGISSSPSPDVQRREDLYAEAREAFFEARRSGGGVVHAG